MAEHTIKMPDVGEGVTEAEIVAWHVAVGEMVEEDQDLVDVMTDKATVEIPSPVSGRVTRIEGEAGDMISVGSLIVVIETDADVEAVSDEERVAEPAPKPKAEPDPPKSEPPLPEAALVQTQVQPAQKPVSTSSQNGNPLASPAVRQRALELDIDLSDVTGSGPAGRVMRSDLEDFIAAGGRAMARASHQAGSSSAPLTGMKETRVIGLRRKIAQNMEAAWKVPMITYVEEIDVTDIETLRQTLNARRKAEQPKLTLLPFLTAALIRGLKKVPHANAHYDPEAGMLTEYHGVHLGIATATDKGLVVPVVRHAEALDIWGIATELNRLSTAARDGTAKREELSGSTITITSLGAIGGIVTTPILNTPETAIIGVNKIVERPAFDGFGNVVPRKFMNLSSSFDHRIVDGYEAATLIQVIREYLETPAMLFVPGAV